MDFLSLDILKALSIFARAWRRLRRGSPRHNDEIIRYNITGLQIIVINSEGRILSHSFESSTSQFVSETHGLIESLFINVELERSVRAESE